MHRASITLLGIGVPPQHHDVHEVQIEVVDALVVEQLAHCFDGHCAQFVVAVEQLSREECAEGLRKLRLLRELLDNLELHYQVG